MSVKAGAVSENVLNVLRNNGAEIKNDSVIEVLNVEGTADSAICVKNVEGEEIVQDVFVAYAENEKGDIVIDNTLAESITRSSDHNIPVNYPTDDGRYLFHATATAAKYVDTASDPYGWFPFYKPYKCSFYYEKFENVTINSIEVQYIVTGTKYSYPGYEYLGGSYDHMVSVSKTNPVEGSVYTNYNYFPENFVLACDDDDDMLLTFITRVNGGNQIVCTIRLTNEY